MTTPARAVHPTQTIGHLRVTALLDGVQDLTGEPITESFPDIPADRLLGYRDRYPGVYGAGGQWRLHIRAWLIRAPGALIVVDTGIGGPGAPGQDRFGATGDLLTEIEAEGIQPMDVNTVIITHVHDDHIGGAVTAEGEPAFPSARYVLQRTDHDWLRDEAGKSEEDAAIWETLMAPLVSRGALDLVDGEAEIADGVSVRLAPGHTPGHQIVRVTSESRRLIISGDAFNHPAQLSYPDWPSGSDVLHAEAATSRRTIIAELGSHGGSVLAPNHFGEPFGKMVFGPDHLAGWRPL